MNNTSVEITAGLGGFLVLFFLAIALILLGMDLNRRLRRLKHQEELRQAEERLVQERRAQDGDVQPGGAPERQAQEPGDDERPQPTP